jgi:RHS repeat-associated protein
VPALVNPAGLAAGRSGGSSGGPQAPLAPGLGRRIASPRSSSPQAARRDSRRYARTFDPQGNPCQRLDSSGNVLSSHFFDAYGAGYNSPSGTNPAPFGFGGQWGYYTDSETNLVLLTNRYYDPARGRFLTRDPAGYGGGINLYGYVGNSPLSGIDPLGLCGDAPDASAQEGIDQVRAGYHAFWGGVRTVGNVLNAGPEAAAGLNPLTSAGIAFNKLHEGKYGEAALFVLPVVDAFGGEGGAAGEPGTFYHGTDIGSALDFLNGAGLDAGEAAARAKGGSLGFYMAREYEAAEAFGLRAGHALNTKGTVLKYEISQEGVAQLQAGGASIRPIPFGGGLGNPKGNEFFIPPGAFDLFNQLREAGQIRVTPFRG